jgi:uncharacterized membrane protein
MSDSDNDAPNPNRLPLTQEEWGQIPSDLRQKIQKVTLEQRLEITQGPLPRPEVLADYDRALPGLAAKLVEWTENETGHRHQLEDKSFEEAKSLRSRAQVLGVAVSVIGLVIAGVVGAFAAINDSFSGATAASVIAIVSVGGPFSARLLAAAWNRNRKGPEDE